MARRKLLRFVTYIRKDYEVNWHHAYICAALDMFARGLIKNLMIFVPPQHGKSELSSRQLPAYMLGLNPDNRIAVCSYSDTLSGRFSRDCQKIIDSAEYKKLFPRTFLSSKTTKKTDVAYQRNSDIFEIVGHKGYYMSAGIRTGLTGNSVDIGIIDDPFKDRLEAESQTMRDNVWNWYTDVYKTRLHNGSQTLLLQTRWHEDDLAGRLLAKDDERAAQGFMRKWTVINLPAIKEDNSNPDDPRQIGEALWESKHSRETILEQKDINLRTYYSLYQQRPRPLEGNIIKTEKFSIITWADFLELVKHKPTPVWQFKGDTAYTEKTQNDPSAFLSATLIDNITYIRRVKSVRKELPEAIEYVKEFAALNGYGDKSYIRIEPKASGLSIVQAIKKGTMLNVEPFKFPKVRGVRMDNKDKVTRAHAITDIIQVGRVVLIDDGTGWVKTFMDQCSGFPNATHDDEVDVFVMQLLEFYFGKVKKKIKNIN